MTSTFTASGETIVVIVFVCALLVVMLLGLAITPDRPARLHRRLAAIGASGRSEPAGGKARPQASLRRHADRALLGDFGRRVQALVPRASTLQLRLARAGLRMGVTDFVGLFVMIGAGAGIVAWAKLGSSPFLAVGVALIFSTGLPNLLLRNRIAARNRRFVLLLPDAIDLIVRGVRSGLPVAEAISAIGDEMEEPVGGCFREVTGSLRLGMPMNEALWAVADRIQIQEFKFFVISLSIQQETGGNLAEILQNLSTMIRRREQVKLKIKAMSSEARASAMIVGSLPFVMAAVIYLINPEYILQLFIDPRGWLLLGAGLTSMTLGLGVMARMVRFEI
jgi:tight adherence protein B